MFNRPLDVLVQYLLRDLFLLEVVFFENLLRNILFDFLNAQLLGLLDLSGEKSFEVVTALLYRGSEFRGVHREQRLKKWWAVIDRNLIRLVVIVFLLLPFPTVLKCFFLNLAGLVWI